MDGRQAPTEVEHPLVIRLRYAARAVGVGVAAFGVLGVLLQLLLPVGFGVGRLPTVAGALFLAFAGLSLAAHLASPTSRWHGLRRAWAALALLTVLLGAVPSDQVLGRVLPDLPFTGALPLAGGLLLSLALLLLQRPGWSGRVAWWGAATVAAFSLFVIIDYLYAFRVNSHDFVFAPLVPGAALAYAFLSFAMLLGAIEDTPLRVLRSGGPGGFMMRRLLLPALVFPMLLLGLLRVMVLDWGLDESFGYSLVTSALILLLVSVICYQSLVLERLSARARHKLEESEARLKLAMDIASVGYWERDMLRGEVYFSPEWKRLLGYDEDEFPNTDAAWCEHLHPDERDGVLAKVEAAVASGEPGRDIEMRLRHKSGSYRWMVSRALAERDEAGDLVKLRGVYLDITERKEVERQIRQISLHDPLTGLPNRALIYEFAEPLLASARRHDKYVAVLFIDLDRFKPINDEHGHDVGDEVLKEVAKRLRTSVREADQVGRLGGDEFIIVLTEVRSDDDAARVARVCGRRLARPYMIRGLKLHTTPSIGISVFPRDGQNIEMLIQHADAAMYEAKRAGRNTFRFFRREEQKRVQ